MQEEQPPLFDLPPGKAKKKKVESLGHPSVSIGYKKYLLSPEWKKKREKAFRILGRKCIRCDRTVGIEVHHKNYRNLYKETSADVEILCSICHPAADSKRERETAFSTYLDTKYGDNASYYDTPEEHEEFCDWLERKHDWPDS
jgi:5-methylcytosine-specific restriction endonuclease McrA